MKTAYTNFVNRWNPYQTFVISFKELKEWYETYGSSCFYDGFQWKPKSEKLMPGIIEVRFIKI